MLGYILSFLFILSAVFGISTGNSGNVSKAAVQGASEGVQLLISMGGIIILWSGIMKIGEKSGLLEVFSRILAPVTKRLFPGVKSSSEAHRSICMNIAANFLGLGNAATPFGIKAMNEMAKLSGNTGKATRDMVVFTVLNTASIQLIPSTIAAIRAANGSNAPFEILPCAWITSVFAAFCGVTMAVILCTGKKEKEHTKRGRGRKGQ